MTEIQQLIDTVVEKLLDGEAGSVTRLDVLRDIRNAADAMQAQEQMAEGKRITDELANLKADVAAKEKRLAEIAGVVKQRKTRSDRGTKRSGVMGL